MAEVVYEKPNASFFEMVISSIFAALAWALSFTILFPLFVSLKFFTGLRNRFFTWFFCTICPIVFPSAWNTDSMRKQLFQLLPVNSKKNLKLLEIGVGGGSNFKFYPESCDVTLVDMNKNFDVEIKKTLKKYPNIRLEKTVFAMAEDMQGIPDSTYDVALCTHLLCSVQDATAVLKEVSRVLQPEGLFIYMEHVGFPKRHIASKIQTIISPLWKVYLNGCTLHRQTHKKICKVFPYHAYRIIYPMYLHLFYRPHAIGIASHSKLPESTE